MKILIVSEKAWLSRAIAPVIRANWPTEKITFVHAVPFANLKFSYPRGLRIQDYPRVSEPVHGLVSWANWVHKPYVMDAQGGLTETSMGPEHFTEADLIVYACDPDHTGAVAFDVLMGAVFGDDRARNCPALRLSSLDQASVEKAFSELKPFGEACGKSLEYGSVKRYFDWNWNVNALAVLGEAARRAGVPGDAPPLSKYSLQLLYAMRNTAPMSDGAVAKLMDCWPGTGRYTYAGNEWRPRMGGMASRGQIVENLVAGGLLTENVIEPLRPLGEYESPPTTLELSGRGQSLLELLHPDCEDPDLPFRLHAWCVKGPGAKPAIDRYIKTFFGKQLRLNAAAHFSTGRA